MHPFHCNCLAKCKNHKTYLDDINPDGCWRVEISSWGSQKGRAEEAWVDERAKGVGEEVVVGVGPALQGHVLNVFGLESP